MKSITNYIAVSVISSLLITSCSEDFLDTTPTSAYTEATYVKNAEELETLLFSCYSIIGTYFPPPGDILVNLPFNMFIFGNVGSDDARGRRAEKNRHHEGNRTRQKGDHRGYAEEED